MRRLGFVLALLVTGCTFSSQHVATSGDVFFYDAWPPTENDRALLVSGAHDLACPVNGVSAVYLQYSRVYAVDGCGARAVYAMSCETPASDKPEGGDGAPAPALLQRDVDKICRLKLTAKFSLAPGVGAAPAK